jgi:hypothetical protein
MILDSDDGSQPRARLGALLLSMAAASALAAQGAWAASPLPAGAPVQVHARPRGVAAPTGPARPAGVAPRKRSSGQPSQARAPASGARAHRAPVRRKVRKLSLRGDPARALLSFEAMQAHDYVAGSGLYVGEPFSSLWDFSQALADTVSMANIAGMKSAFMNELHVRLVGLASYLDTTNSGEPEGTFTSTLTAFDGVVAPPAGPGGAKFFDDNDWVGIELARVYELTHNTAALGFAEGIMAFEMAGWQASPELACPGGIPFSNTGENSTRNTVTDAPTAELGVQLYRITRRLRYLQFAEMAYEWVRHCLLASSGLYADNISRGGVVDPTLWSYNQGSMIGAGALLYQATGNGAYLYQARQTARAALAYFTPERLASEIPFFPSVYFRNLLYLDSITHDPPGRKLAQAYVDYAWAHLRLADNLFTWGSPPSTQLLVQAAIAQIYALLSSPPRSYF